MKRRDFLKLSAALALGGAAAACSSGSSTAASAAVPAAPASSAAPAASTAPAASAAASSGAAEEPAGSRALVVVYSATGNTRAVAGYIAEAAGADLFELQPIEPYSSDDLAYNDSGSRVSREHADPALQDIPLEAETVEGWESYDTVFVGYPIWWGDAAWPVNRFITGNDFAGKRVVPFCTSASSGLGDSDELLAEMAASGDWLEGRRFGSRAGEEEVLDWLAGLRLLDA